MAQLQGARGMKGDPAGNAQAKAAQEERQRAAEDQRSQILKAILAPEARERRKLIFQRNLLCLLIYS